MKQGPASAEVPGLCGEVTARTSSPPETPCSAPSVTAASVLCASEQFGEATLAAVWGLPCRGLPALDTPFQGGPWCHVAVSYALQLRVIPVLPLLQGAGQ